MTAALLAVLLCASGAPDQAPVAAPATTPLAGPLAYPPTRRGDQVDDYFGTNVADPYRWLEDPDGPETRAWVQAQAGFTEAWLAGVPARAALRARLTRLWDYEKVSSPVPRGGRWFYTRNPGLTPQPVLHVTDDLAKDGRVLLDPNALSSDGTVALAAFEPSPDGALVAYAIAEAGSDWLTWRVREVASGKDRPDEVRWSKFSGAAWRKDGSGFYYARFDAPRTGQALTGGLRDHKLWFHRLGAPQAEDVLVFARPDQPEWFVGGEVTDDGRWLVVAARHGTRPESALFLQDLSRPGGKVEPFLDRMDARYEAVDVEGDVFTVLTNQGAPRGRLVAIRRGQPEPAAWRVLIPEGPGTEVLKEVVRAGDRLVATWMRDARSAVTVHDLAGRKVQELTLPSVGTVDRVTGSRRERQACFRFTGFLAPPAVHRLDLASLAARPLRKPSIPFDAAAYQAEQVFFASKDGTRIPMFLVHRKGLALDGRNPTLLYGYGGFNVSLTPAFRVATAAWLELGGVYAVANLRGGGEYGQAWHDAGRLERKQNVFDDFMAAAEWLVARGYTSPARLAIEGGSNGGLLVGACLTQRPELFGAAVPRVGVLDMLRFHLFTGGAAWKSDYASSETREGFEVALRYSPLQAVRPGTRYPATLVVTADHDDRVVPAHSFKFAAALQAAQGGPSPILARIETRAGHSAGKPTGKAIEEAADILAFLVRSLGVALPEGYGAAAR